MGRVGKDVTSLLLSFGQEGTQTVPQRRWREAALTQRNCPRGNRRQLSGVAVIPLYTTFAALDRPPEGLDVLNLTAIRPHATILSSSVLYQMFWKSQAQAIGPAGRDCDRYRNQVFHLSSTASESPSVLGVSPNSSGANFDMAAVHD